MLAERPSTSVAPSTARGLAPRRRRIAAFAVVLVAVALSLLFLWPAPPDHKFHRPQKVARSHWPQQDLEVLSGVRVRYVDCRPPDGSTGPIETVTLIPGHTARLDDYDDLVDALCPRFRVLVMDFPGSGYSDKPVIDYTLTLYEDAQLSMWDRLGVETSHVIGGSLGGNLALRLAHRVPGRIGRVVAWSPASAWEASPWKGSLVHWGSYALFWPIVAIQSRYWWDPQMPGRDARVGEVKAYYREVMGAGFIRMYYGIAGDTVATSLFPIASEISVPTLVIVGEADSTPGMQAGVDRIVRALPNGRKRTFAGAPHSLESVQSDALSREVLGFLSGSEDALSP